MNSPFIEPQLAFQQFSTGALSHLSFAIKDLIDVKDYVTGGGNPTWKNTHEPSQQHAPCVQLLLNAGATFKGKTITDELAYSLEGRNHFFGTPLNPKWPEAMPGGSSSGSASAVALQQVDFSLGTDTGGSVRVPAAFCGIWGIRPTHNAISLTGVLPFASSFDTVGWFAHDIDTFIEVAKVLLPEDKTSLNLNSTLIGVAEAFDYRQQNAPNQAAELMNFAKKMGMHKLQQIIQYPVQDWLACYQYLQDASIKENLGPWIEKYSPEFGPLMQGNFQRVMENDGRDSAKYAALQAEISQQLDDLLSQHILILPTTPMALLNKDIDSTSLALFYQQALTVNAIAGLAGLPQVTIPVKNTQDYPIALSIIGPKHSDLQLIQLAKTLFHLAQDA
ncbi:amidase [Acinetobacter bouvetii]|uniref:Glutamyl-tRNA(Gln) amidotransferase subunit A n=1 Tax=Acinetobacter bouvetii TaxID=202951 RepID=A0A811GEH2_9GAMM|nr:amidase [Acinetobacter bouvetii]CAB1221638.1 Glutamyl-tRNA(Gln) amidotransferase subunit A [Acinetobacter bouvetii]